MGRDRLSLLLEIYVLLKLAEKRSEELRPEWAIKVIEHGREA